MNEITIHGNITAEPTVHFARHSGETVLNFSVAANERRFDRDSGQWRALPPVYHRVVAFRALADHAAETLTKGTLVTVTGKLADDSWTTEDGQRRQGVKLVAEDVSVSLRHATAVVTKRPARRADTAGDAPAGRDAEQASAAEPTESVPAPRTGRGNRVLEAVTTPAN